MKQKILFIFIIGIVFLGITGCKINDGKTENFKPTEIDGISVAIKSKTLTRKNAQIIIKDINGKGTYIYGTEFRIEKKAEEGWIKLNTTNNNCGFNEMAYYVNGDGILEFNQDWECMYGKLENGTYRLIKHTFLESDTPITENDYQYFSIEFTIE